MADDRNWERSTSFAVLFEDSAALVSLSVAFAGIGSVMGSDRRSEAESLADVGSLSSRPR